MKRELLKLSLIMAVMMITLDGVVAQELKTGEQKEGFQFTDEIKLPATPVKNQYRSGTCWSFGTISLIESELIRTGKGEHDLSEMFVVRQTYAAKADRYVRMHGNANFGGGGALPDAFWVMENFGMVPEKEYDGLVIGEKNHVHGEMDGVMKAHVDAVVKNSNRKLTPVWKQAIDGLLDAYLGKVPSTFSVDGKEYTPVSFAAMMGLKKSDYVQFTSFTHQPFYQEMILDVPDNWNWEGAYNVPLDEMIEVIENALTKGYTVVWASDVSEKGFSHRNGVAIVPDVEADEVSGMERAKWEQMTVKEKEELLYSFKNPVKEKLITQEERQKAYDNYSTTDDHAMHIIGSAKDQNGTRYYIVKNSWGTDNNPYGGYLYVSESFVKYKTTSIMLHKDGVPAKIMKKFKN